MHKICDWCGKEFARKPGWSTSTWQTVRCCSLHCGSRARWVGAKGDAYRKRLGLARRKWNQLHPEANRARLAKMAASRGISYPGKEAVKVGRALAAQLYPLDCCVDCGLPYAGPRTLHRHHIDLDKTNNSRENVVVVCPKCHGKRHIGDSTRNTSAKRAALRAERSGAP